MRTLEARPNVRRGMSEATAVQKLEKDRDPQEGISVSPHQGVTGNALLAMVEYLRLISNHFERAQEEEDRRRQLDRLKALASSYIVVVRAFHSLFG